MKRLLSLAIAFSFFIPAFAFADTTNATDTLALTPSVIISQLQTIQSQLNGVMGTSTPFFLSTPYTLTPGQEIVEPDGALAIQFTAFGHTNPDPLKPLAPVTNLAKFTMEANPCATATSSTCVNPNQAVMPLMSAGQSTGYLQYQMNLISLSSTSATIVVSDQSFIIQVKSELNSVTNELNFLSNS